MNVKSFVMGCLLTAGLFLILGFSSEKTPCPKFQVHGDQGVFCILNTQNGDYTMVLPSGDPLGNIHNDPAQRRSTRKHPKLCRGEEKKRPVPAGKP